MGRTRKRFTATHARKYSLRREVSEDVLLHRERAANIVCQALDPTLSVERRRGGVWCEFHSRRARRVITCRWTGLSAGAQIPEWYQAWGRSPAHCRCLHQLTCWVVGDPVLPLTWWQTQFASMVLPPSLEISIESVLRFANWPQEVECLRCGRKVAAPDWWVGMAIAGPACPDDVTDCEVI